MNRPYTLDELIKAGQEQASAEAEPGEKSDEEMDEKEKAKKKQDASEGAPEDEETKTSSVKDLANHLRASAVWLTKAAEGAVPFSEPTPGGQVQADGQMSVEPQVTGEQPHPTPHPPADKDPTTIPSLQADGTVGNTTNDPLTTQTQAEPGNSTAMETGKTNSGPARKEPLAADQAKTSSLGGWIRDYVKQAAEPNDTAAAPGGQPAGADTTTSGGEVGYTEPTEHVPVVSGGDAAATNLTPQEGENTTQKPDLAPLLTEPPQNHSDGGKGTPQVDAANAKLGQDLRALIQGGA